jgi:hypothetical protein
VQEVAYTYICSIHWPSQCFPCISAQPPRLGCGHTHAGRLRSESLFISLTSDGTLDTFTAPPELSSLITSEALVALALKGGAKPGVKEAKGGPGSALAPAAGEQRSTTQAGVISPEASSQAAPPQQQQQQQQQQQASLPQPGLAQPPGMAAGGMRLSVTEEVGDLADVLPCCWAPACCMDYLIIYLISLFIAGASST